MGMEQEFENFRVEFAEWKGEVNEKLKNLEKAEDRQQDPPKEKVDAPKEKWWKSWIPKNIQDAVRLAVIILMLPAIIGGFINFVGAFSISVDRQRLNEVIKQNTELANQLQSIKTEQAEEKKEMSLTAEHREDDDTESNVE